MRCRPRAPRAALRRRPSAARRAGTQPPGLRPSQLDHLHRADAMRSAPRSAQQRARRRAPGRRHLVQGLAEGLGASIRRGRSSRPHRGRSAAAFKCAVMAGHAQSRRRRATPCPPRPPHRECAARPACRRTSHSFFEISCSSYFRTSTKLHRIIILCVPSRGGESDRLKLNAVFHLGIPDPGSQLGSDPIILCFRDLINRSQNWVYYELIFTRG